MKPTKSTVYLPVKENGNYSIHWNKDKIFNHAIMKEGYFFTPEQLNEYIQSIIKQTLETAAEKADSFINMDEDGYMEGNVWSEVDRESITDTFEETYNKLKV